MSELEKTTAANSPDDMLTEMETAQAELANMTEDEIVTLTPEEEAAVQKHVAAILANIDLKKPNETESFCSSYGGSALVEVERASAGAIEGAKIKELDQVTRDCLGIEERIIKFRAFVLLGKVYKDVKAEIKAFTREYKPIEKYIEGMKDDLERHALNLDKEIESYSTRYDAMDKAWRNLVVLVEAGKRALKIMNEELERLKKVAAETPSMENTDAKERYAEFCEDFAATIATLTNSRTDAFRARPSIRMQRRGKRVVWTTVRNQRFQSIPLLLNSIADILGAKSTQAAIELSQRILNADVGLRDLAAKRAGEAALMSEEHRGVVISTTAQSIVAAIDQYIADDEKIKAQREKTKEIMAKSEADLVAAQKRLIASMNK